MKKTSLILIMAAAIVIVSCKDQEKEEDVTQTEKATEMNREDNEQKALFNGQDLDGWKAYNKDSVSDQWKVEDGVLAFTPAEGERESTENLISEKEYENFELSLEWKISEGGNSGIIWGVKEGEEFNEPYQTGPEIQILDNERHPDAKNGPVRQAGALYDMVPPEEDVTNPAGEWNEMVITIDYDENKGSVALNGTRVNEFALHGQEWEQMVEDSKFKDWEDFGKSRRGHIALQDHGDKVWFRNIKIKELD